MVKVDLSDRQSCHSESICTNIMQVTDILKVDDKYPDCKYKVYVE